MHAKMITLNFKVKLNIKNYKIFQQNKIILCKIFFEQVNWYECKKEREAQHSSSNDQKIFRCLLSYLSFV